MFTEQSRGDKIIDHPHSIYELLTAPRQSDILEAATAKAKPALRRSLFPMELIERDTVEKQMLPGRALQQAVGKNAHVASKKMSMGFVRYAAESGPMEPHHHAEEIVYVIKSDRAWVRFGPDKDQLGDPIPLETGMTMHFPELEWHVFQYEEGGHLDAIFFYGQVEGIRPEEKKD